MNRLMSPTEPTSPNRHFAKSPNNFGVRIAGVGSAVPDKVLTNFDLEKMLDTSDEWIVQRTGIHQRRIVDQKTEGTYTLSRDALTRALANAGMTGRDLDLVIVASVTSEMTQVISEVT